MAAAPEEGVAARLGSRSSGTEASAPSPEEAVLNQEAVENREASGACA